MTNSIHRHLLLALVLVVSADVDAQNPQVYAQNPHSHPLAVLPFVAADKETKDLAPKVTQLLFANLASDPGIVLVERELEDFRKVLDETELDLSGLVDAEKAAQVAHLTGAKLLVTGSIVQ